MHPTQVRILQLAKTINIDNLSLREIGKLVNENHPQNVKHHLSQLVSHGFIKVNGNVNLKPKSLVNFDFVNIPIIGSANCGPAKLLAEDNFLGLLTVSKSILSGHNKTYALQAEGDSMNKAKINNKPIDDGDYVLFDSLVKRPENGRYVVSNINGCLNIKRFYHDKENKQIILRSESTQNIPPIFISKTDYEDYFIVGEVFSVIKNPKIIND